MSLSYKNANYIININFNHLNLSPNIIFWWFAKIFNVDKLSLIIIRSDRNTTAKSIKWEIPMRWDYILKTEWWREKLTSILPFNKIPKNNKYPENLIQ